jgi:hypothetical protein
MGGIAIDSGFDTEDLSRAYQYISIRVCREDSARQPIRYTVPTVLPLRLITIVAVDLRFIYRS